MRCIDLVLAVDAAGGDDADGQGAGLHRVYLHRRGLGAQQDAAVVLEIEGVRPFAGGVAFVDVELGEVVFRLLDLGAVENFKAHAYEDVLDLV